jgi:hypothetical protein
VRFSSPEPGYELARMTSSTCMAAASRKALPIVVVAIGVAASTSSLAGTHVSSARSCDGERVRRVVVSFISAFNRGDRTRLQGLWSRSDFQWYSVTRTQASHYVTHDRATMLRYFAARHRHLERLRLVRFEFNGVSGGFGHFEYSLTRRARDLAGGVPEGYHGKGAVTCGAFAPRLAVWSMGRA